MNRERIADALMDVWWETFIGAYPGLLSSLGRDRDKWRAWLDCFDRRDSWAVGRIRSARSLTTAQADALVAAGCVPSDELTQAARASLDDYWGNVYDGGEAPDRGVLRRLAAACGYDWDAAQREALR